MRNIEEDFERFVSIFDELVPEARGGAGAREVRGTSWGVSLEIRENGYAKPSIEIFLVVHRDGEEFGDEAMWGVGSDAWISLESAAKRAAQLAKVWLKGPQTGPERLAHDSYLNRRRRRAADNAQ